MKKTDLSISEQEALQKFLIYLQSIPAQIEKVALFGSKARGDSQEDSDIDVLVILKKEDRSLRREILKEAARISLKYDLILSPRIIGATRWQEMRGFSLYQNLQKEAAGLELIRGKLALGT